MTTVARTFRELVEQARATRIEVEIAQRSIQLKGTVDRCGPCPRCGGRDRFSINIRKQIFFCRGCQVGGDVIAVVMHLDQCDFVTAVETLAGEARPIARQPARSPQANDSDRIKSALRWWCEAGPIEETLGIAYLEREREIFELPPNVHEVLRFHGRCIWGQDKAGQCLFRPCILGLLRDVIDDEPTGVQRIALDPNGKLIGRMALGRKKGSAIKLWGDAEVTTGLVVGEGTETVLAAATRVHHRGTLLQPAWSLVDAGNLEMFPIISAIEHLTILADADESNRGQDAARNCAKRWAEAGRDAVVLIPDQLGQDFNDIAREQKRQVAS